MSGPRINFTYPVYPDLTVEKGGFLPDDKRAFALWYYYTLAQKMYEKVGKSIDDQFGILEGDPWLDSHYEQLARSIAVVYQFKDPGVFMENRFWEVVKKQAELMGYPEPKDAYMKPLRLIGIH